MRVLLRAAAVFAAFILLGGCSPEPLADDGLRVVATTTMLGDLTSQLGGDYISLETLMSAGVDPHTYQASAGDMERLAGADMVICSGLGLEGKMAEVLASMDDRAVFVAGDALDETDLRYADGAPDPHIWLSVPLWTKVARSLSAELASLDPEHADAYAQLLDDYLLELDALDAYIREQASALDSRILVTSHAAFGYFGAEYGFETHGIQGANTSAEAGAADVAALADLVCERDIRAVFPETSVSPKSAEALVAASEARGHALAVGEALYSDSLGSLDEAAYTAAMRSNIDSIVASLGGEAPQ